METTTQLSEALRTWRKRRKLTQMKAALTLRVSPDTYRRWEQARNLPHQSEWDRVWKLITR